jgi:hypothetical protein
MFSTVHPRVRPSLAAIALALALASLTATATAVAQTGPVVVLPAFGAGGAANVYYSFSLRDGAGVKVDRLRREPLDLRTQAWGENLFQVIGRPAGQPATPGEIFLEPIRGNDGSVRAAIYVETTIGYVAYFNDLGKGSKIGEISTVAGRPYETIGSSDGNYALLTRSASSGRTEGAYLYHATSGRGIYLDGMAKLSITGKIVTTSPLPTLTGPVAAVPLFLGSKATSGYLVVDPSSGEIHFLATNGALLDQLATRKSPLNLYDALSREGACTSPRRLTLAAIQRDKELTLHALVFDAVTGGMALIENVHDQTLTRLTLVRANLDSELRSTGGERLLTPIPNPVSGGQTLGVWVHDSQSGRLLYIANPADPAATTVTRVAFGG